MPSKSSTNSSFRVRHLHEQKTLFLAVYKRLLFLYYLKAVSSFNVNAVGCYRNYNDVTHYLSLEINWRNRWDFENERQSFNANWLKNNEQQVKNHMQKNRTTLQHWLSGCVTIVSNLNCWVGIIFLRVEGTWKKILHSKDWSIIMLGLEWHHK